MRFVPPPALNIAVLTMCIASTSGCGGGSASMTSSSISTTPGSSMSSNAAPSPASTANSTAPSAPPAASPPSSGPTGTTISNIEQMSGWDSCDLCSGGGPIGYSMTQALSYPQAGSTRFSLGQGVAWAHALWWKRLGNDPSPSHFVLTLDQYIDSPEASFGVEYDVNQIVNGEWYDFAIQCSFGYGIWQLWDDANQRWVPTSVPCPRPVASTNLQLRLEFERSNGLAHFVSIGANGSVTPVNVAFNPQPINGASGDFGVHIQLNANGNPDPYSVWVHNLALNYW